MRSRLLMHLLVTLGAAAASLGLLAGTAGAASRAGMYAYTSKGDAGATFYGGDVPSELSARWTATPRPSWHLHDASGVTLSVPSYDCVAADPTTVDCTEVSRLDVGTGPHGGRISLASAPDTSGFVNVSGGAGDDVVTAGPGVRVGYAISGGQDTFTAVSGHATAGVRTLGPQDAMEIDLGAGTARRGTDLTTMTGVDRLTVAGPNHVVGTDGPDDVYQQGGSVVAGSGDDVLSGFGTFDAGPGDDVVSLTGHATVTCGPGLDEVASSPSSVRLAGDCERLAAFPGPERERIRWIDPRPHRVPGRSGRVRFRLRCGASAAGPCHGRLVVGDGRVRSRVRVDVGMGRSAWVTVRTPGGRRVALGARLRMRLAGDRNKARSWTAPVIR